MPTHGKKSATKQGWSRESMISRTGCESNKLRKPSFYLSRQLHHLDITRS